MKQYLKLTLMFIVMSLAGCASSPKDPAQDGSGQASNSMPIEGMSISYNLPMTRATLTATYTLESCDTLPKVGLRTAVSTSSVANSDEKLHFRINASTLKSKRKNKNVSVVLHANGAINTIGSTITDQTPAIVGGLINFAASVLSFGDSSGERQAIDPAEGVVVCNTTTLAALKLRDELRREIKGIRESFLSGTDQKKKAERVDALSAELARVIMGPLTIERSRALDLNDRESRGAVIKWKDSEFSKWLKKEKTTDRNGILIDDKNGLAIESKSMDLFSLKYCIYSSNEEGVTADSVNSCSDDGLAKPFNGLPSEEVLCIGGSKCLRQIVLREPVQASVTITAVNSNEIRKSASVNYLKDDVISTSRIRVSQFGEINYLPLTVGFGGNRTSSLTLDEYGRKSSFMLNSSASVAGFVRGLNSVVQNVTNFRSATADATPLEVQQATITELDTRLRLNRLEACRIIIESGGFTCPN